MSDDGATPDAESAEVESGPYCRHFCDPSECNYRCATCGHECRRHNDDECTKWIETFVCKPFTFGPETGGGAVEGLPEQAAMSDYRAMI